MISEDNLVFQKGFNQEQRRNLPLIVEKMNDYIASIQSLALELLEENAAKGSAAPSSMEIVIKVAPEKPPQGEVVMESSPPEECWTAHYIFGKGPSGYIICSTQVCIGTGPVTMSP